MILLAQSPPWRSAQRRPKPARIDARREWRHPVTSRSVQTPARRAERREFLKLAADCRQPTTTAGAIVRTRKSAATQKLRFTSLQAVCLNRRLDGASLVATMNKPFDVLAEGLDSAKSRDGFTWYRNFRSVVH